MNIQYMKGWMMQKYKEFQYLKVFFKEKFQYTVGNSPRQPFY